jgi:hypothetical protein
MEGDVLMEISNDLLTEIMPSVYRVNETEVRGEVIYWTGENEEGDPINGGLDIYRAAHRCKVWTWEKYGITIRSGYAEFGGWSNFAHNQVSFVSMDIPYSEPEAVILAAQRVLENRQ